MSKLTKEQLQGVEDHELNDELSLMVSRHANYCDSPNDIMPLQFEHKICLIDSEAGWIAFLFDTADGDIEFEDKNPLRAIACCLILVLQEKS